MFFHAAPHEEDERGSQIIGDSLASAEIGSNDGSACVGRSEDDASESIVGDGDIDCQDESFVLGSGNGGDDITNDYDEEPEDHGISVNSNENEENEILSCDDTSTCSNDEESVDDSGDECDKHLSSSGDDSCENGEEPVMKECDANDMWKKLASFIKKHNLTDRAGDDLIKLIETLRNEQDSLPSSMYEF